MTEVKDIPMQEIYRLIGRGEAVISHELESPKVGDKIEVNGMVRIVKGIESFGNKPPWGVILETLR